MKYYRKNEREKWEVNVCLPPLDSMKRERIHDPAQGHTDKVSDIIDVMKSPEYE